MEFAYDGGGLAKGGDVKLYYHGAPPTTHSPAKSTECSWKSAMIAKTSSSSQGTVARR
jgi:hypothetical protein